MTSFEISDQLHKDKYFKKSKKECEKTLLTSKIATIVAMRKSPRRTKEKTTFNADTAILQRLGVSVGGAGIVPSGKFDGDCVALASSFSYIFEIGVLAKIGFKSSRSSGLSKCSVSSDSTLSC